MKAMNPSTKSPFCRIRPPCLYGCCLLLCLCLGFPAASQAALSYQDALARALDQEARHQAEEHEAGNPGRWLALHCRHGPHPDRTPATLVQ